MLENGKDRRVQKTRMLLQDALISLIGEKGFDTITIQELLDRANVGRSTFYLHFENKGELLHSCFEAFNNRFDAFSVELLRTTRQGADGIAYMAGFFRFIEKNHGFLKSLMGEYGAGMFQTGIQAYVSGFLESMIHTLDGHKKITPVKKDMLTHYAANAMIGVLKWWVESDMPCPADELAQYVMCQVSANIDKAIHL